MKFFEELRSLNRQTHRIACLLMRYDPACCGFMDEEVDNDVDGTFKKILDKARDMYEELQRKKDYEDDDEGPPPLSSETVKQTK